MFGICLWAYQLPLFQGGEKHILKKTPLVQGLREGKGLGQFGWVFFQLIVGFRYMKDHVHVNENKKIFPFLQVFLE